MQYTVYACMLAAR